MVTRGLVFHPLFCIVLIIGIVFGVFVHEGLFKKYVMAICEFDELDCVVGGR